MTKLVELTNTDPAFYGLLGPFLARREVHAALGGVPFDDDTKTWIVLKKGTTVLGFCAVNQMRRRTLLESLYLTPGHEHRAGELVRAAVDRYGYDRDLHATVRYALAGAHTEAGFHRVKDLTNFTVLVRPATVRETARG